MKKALIAVSAVVAIVLVGVGGWAAFGSDDDATVTGTCGSASYQLSRESDDGGLEMTFELQSAAPDEIWDVSLLQGDTPILIGQRSTDEDAELDVDAPADEAAGTAFSITATPAAGGDTCTASIS